MIGVKRAVLWSAASALAGVVIWANLPTEWTLGAAPAELSQLSTARLQLIPPGQLRADFLTGTLIQEALSLSSLRQRLDAKGVPLIAIVHEPIGIDDFRAYFQGSIYLDSQRAFFGPKERWMNVWMGALRWSTWSNVLRAKRQGVEGNLEGEGRLLGGVFVIGRGSQGVLLEHSESAWGDHVEPKRVLQALDSIATG